MPRKRGGRYPRTLLSLDNIYKGAFEDYLEPPLQLVARMLRDAAPKHIERFILSSSTLRDAATGTEDHPVIIL